MNDLNEMKSHFGECESDSSQPTEYFNYVCDFIIFARNSIVTYDLNCVCVARLSFACVVVVSIGFEFVLIRMCLGMCVDAL